MFYRGYDVFDQRKRRLRLRPCLRKADISSRRSTRRVPGNSNGGHLYGTTLSDAEKSALVEYLKVF